MIELVGSPGIKKRKKYRRPNARTSAPMSDGDVQRLFGRFSWNEYSPAGAMERNGFLLRQLKRYDGDGKWRVFAVLARLFVILVLLAFAAGLLFQIARLI